MTIKLILNLLVILNVLNYVQSDEVIIQIFIKKIINEISDRFVSFSVDPKNLLDIYRHSNSENFTNIAKSLSPAYFKISGPTSNKIILVSGKDLSSKRNDIQIGYDEWKNLYKWMKFVNFKPVIALRYNPRQWQSRYTIRDLVISNGLGVDNCVWQLGSDFNATDAINYVDDLTTLRTIINAFLKKNKNDWRLMGADLSIGSNPDETALYTELSQHIVEAIGWQTPSEEHTENVGFFDFDRDAALRNLFKSNKPMWLNLMSHNHGKQVTITTTLCSEYCLAKGLTWAQNLGDAARNGYHVIYKPFDKTDLLDTSFSYYITLIHKRVIGERVFDTKLLNGDKESTFFYTHCTRSISGSFTVMGVNFGSEKIKVTTKMPVKYTGSEVMQYILTVNDDGHISLNGDTVNMYSSFEPYMKVKRPNKPINFILPPQSVGFWVFPMANIRECMDFDTSNEYDNQDFDESSKELIAQTSSDLLLKQLIQEAIEKETENFLARMKNQNNSESDRAKRDIVKTTDQINPTEIEPKVSTRKRRFILEDEQLQDPNYMYFEKFLNNNRRFSRQIGSGNLARLFDKLDIKMPNTKKLFNLKSLNLNKPSGEYQIIPPVATVHDVYRKDSNNLFDHRENKDFPKGDLYLDVASRERDDTTDYVSFGDPNNKKPRASVSDQYVRTETATLGESYSNLPPNEYMGEYERKQKSRQQIQQSSRVKPSVGDIWEADRYYSDSDTYDQVLALQQNQIDNDQNGHMVKYVVRELEPTTHKNEENLQKARNNLNNYYIFDEENQDSLGRDRYEGYFMTRRKRSTDRHSLSNDEIEKRLIELTEPTSSGKTGKHQKNNLLNRLSEIMVSLESIDDLTDLDGIIRLNEQIKDIEDFLIKKPLEKLSGGKKSKQPKKVESRNDSRRKCKILALNLEQQCLLEEDSFQKILRKRDLNIEKKSTQSVKNFIMKISPTKSSRGKRHAVWSEKSSFDDQMDNMIHKIEGLNVKNNKYNKIYPSISFSTDGQESDSSEENPLIKRIPEPKIASVIAGNVQNLVDIIDKHVTGWWKSMMS